MPQSIYEPINGREARQILKKSLGLHIDNDKQLALFKEGNAFHRIEMYYGLTVTCFPADCPVPEMELQLAMKAPDMDDKALEQLEKTTKAGEALDKKKAELLASIEKIDTLLQKIRPTIDIEESLSAGNTPDELRIAHGLPTPQLIRQTLATGEVKKQEVMVNAGEGK